MDWLKSILPRDSRKRYSPEEIELFEKHLDAYFGPSESVFHELASLDGTHIDIYLVEPTEKYPCYRLITCGMGARRMSVPREARGQVPDRIELMLSLPADWRFDEKSMEEDRFGWPVSLLKYLARFPWSESTWLGWGHTLPLAQFADNTQLSGVFIDAPEHYPFDAFRVVFPKKRAVYIFQAVPVYDEEIGYAVEHGSEELEKLLKDVVCSPVDVGRKNYAAGK